MEDGGRMGRRVWEEEKEKKRKRMSFSIKFDFRREGKIEIDSTPPVSKLYIQEIPPLLFPLPHLFPLPPHINNTSYTIPLLHHLKRLIDLSQLPAMRDELVHLQLAVQVVGHQIRQLRSAFDAAEGTPFPHAAGHELESYGGGLAGGGVFRGERRGGGAYVSC